MNEIEKAFIETFVREARCGRSLSLLASSKNRHKFRNRLAHEFDADLINRFAHDKDNVPADIAAQIQKELDKWKKANPEQLRYIIANSERDGQMMTLHEAEEDFLLTFGAIIIIIPDKLAYYHTERSNLNRQPFYVLFRP